MNIIEIWKQCPSVPFPTLDHHLLHVTTGIAIMLAFIVLFKHSELIAAIAAWGIAFVVEVLSVILFNETIRNAANDMAQYSFVWAIFFAIRKQWSALVVAVGVLSVAYYFLTVWGENVW